MKKPFSISHSVVFLLIIVLLVSLSIAVIHPNQPHQAPPPEEELALQIGSTNGITVLAFIIAGVITLPLLTSGAFNRKKKSQEE
jgi:heme/copper-type cytochrome/quinol oxidase subunit 2